MTPTELKVRLYPDPCLRQKCEKVSEVGPSERMLIEAMLATMHKQKGIGLAAPQVGINRRIFVADIGDGPIAFVNPVIKKGPGAEKFEEGCLSIPGINVNVVRPEKIHVSYLDYNNQKQSRNFSELMARVIQHENDHLDGKLIIDYASKSDKEKIASKLAELEKANKGKK